MRKLNPNVEIAPLCPENQLIRLIPIASGIGSKVMLSYLQIGYFFQSCLPRATNCY